MGIKLSIILLCIFIFIFTSEIYELLKSTNYIKEEDVTRVLIASACHIFLM